MNGENLFNAANVMHKTTGEINTMLGELSAQLIKTIEMKTMRLIDPADDELYDESSNWICTDMIYNVHIYKNGAKICRVYLAIQIKLCNQEEAKIVGKQPLLYVMFSAEANWSLDEFLLHTAINEGFELEGFVWRRYNKNEEPIPNLLWWETAEFAFVLPLMALNTKEDLQTLIVDPIHSLMTEGLDPNNLDKRTMKFEIKDFEVRLLP